jgi:ankyrin repeat protein
MLTQYVRSGAYDEVAELLRSSPARQEDLDNSLAVAAKYGHERLVGLLIQHGADPNAQPSRHMPALFCAVEQENLAIVRLLVERGADVNLQPDGDWTPLHNAVDIEGDGAWQTRQPATADLTRLLLELGADPDRVDAKGRRPIDLAREYEHVEAIKVLEQYKFRSGRSDAWPE